MRRGGRNVSVGSSSAYRANYQAPKKQIHIGSLWRPILVAISLVFASYVVLFSPLFRVRAIAVQGNTKLTSSQVSDQVMQILRGSFLGDNALFVNGVELEKAIKQRNYQIEQVRVERSLLGGLRVTIREQQATLQWRSGSSVFVLSGNGVAYAELGEVDGKLPAVEDSTNLPVKTGQKIVPSSFVGFVVKIKPQLEVAGIKAEAISVSETTTEVAVKTNKGFIMKFDTTRSLESQLADYKAIAARKIVPKEYVDLRIAGRVFYK